jgi:hypothetical protein
VSCLFSSFSPMWVGGGAFFIGCFFLCVQSCWCNLVLFSNVCSVSLQCGVVFLFTCVLSVVFM